MPTLCKQMESKRGSFISCVSIDIVDLFNIITSASVIKGIYMQCAELCWKQKTCYESGGNRITNIALIGCFDSFLWANNVLNMVVNFLNKVGGARKSH